MSDGLSEIALESNRPRLLDLFCGGGGMSMGYYLAGFDVVGVDNAKQPRYPFTFFQADALEFVDLYGRYFDAIHASPPCQAYSRLAARHPEREYPDLVEPTRDALRWTRKPYVIENVPGAPLQGFDSAWAGRSLWIDVRTWNGQPPTQAPQDLRDELAIVGAPVPPRQSSGYLRRRSRWSIRSKHVGYERGAA